MPKDVVWGFRGAVCGGFCHSERLLIQTNRRPCQGSLQPRFQKAPRWWPIEGDRWRGRGSSTSCQPAVDGLRFAALRRCPRPQLCRASSRRWRVQQGRLQSVSLPPGRTVSAALGARGPARRLGRLMFDVYLSYRRDLLIVRKGSSLPISVSGRWRKRKRKVISVSGEIRSAIERQGYYMRKVSDLKKH
jgi:hypothetical protein